MPRPPRFPREKLNLSAKAKRIKGGQQREAMGLAYWTVRDAAREWGISERLVQQLCSDARIDGARRFGRSWAIPEGAPKPDDPRRARRSASAGDLAFERVPMPLMNTAFEPGSCASCVEEIEDEDVRAIARAELHYFRGQADQAAGEAEPYLASRDPALRLSACWIFGFASLTRGEIASGRRALSGVQEILASVDESVPPEHRAIAAFMASGAAVLLHLPVPEAARELPSLVPLLPRGLRLFALYLQAHHAYLQGDYGRCVGLVDAAFAVRGETYPIVDIYLHLAAVMGHMGLRQTERAQEHLLAAWGIARPDGLIEPFGEHHGLLGGMLEAVIKPAWPEEFRRVIDITYRFSAGWRRVHNPATGDAVADNLTTTEFAACMLATRGWTNQEIAEHLGVSANTVKSFVSSALRKLGIKRRQDLRRFMLS